MTPLEQTACFLAKALGITLESSEESGRKSLYGKNNKLNLEYIADECTENLIIVSSEDAPYIHIVKRPEEAEYHFWLAIPKESHDDFVRKYANIKKRLNTLDHKISYAIANKNTLNELRRKNSPHLEELPEDDYGIVYPLLLKKTALKKITPALIRKYCL